MGSRVLYISYDGLLEPLGQSQVVAYIVQLAKRHRISVISFEKPRDLSDERRRESLSQKLQAAEIDWHPLRYHRRPSIPATAWDLAAGLALSRRLVKTHSIDIVHARSYVPSILALALKREFDVKYVFDMRGLWADEKVDAGSWRSSSVIYRMAKRFERSFLLSADVVVSLTRSGVAAIRQFDYLQHVRREMVVIPTCVDLQRFTPVPDLRTSHFTLGYAGNALGWYDFQAFINVYMALKVYRPDARLLIVNHGQHSFIRDCLASNGIPASDAEVVGLAFADMPNAMRRMDAAAFYLRPSFSKQASAPTRLGEFLGSGVPCLVNAGVGDFAELVAHNRVGAVIHDTSAAEADAGARSLLAVAADPTIRRRCVAVAEREFSLAMGVERYAEVYDRLGSCEMDVRSSTTGCP